MKPLTREWVRKAENDFKAASQLLRRRKDIVPVSGGMKMQ